MAKGTWTPTRPRGPIAAEFQTPGPGSCNIPSSIGKESPAYTIVSRREVKDKKEVPAPNEYNTRQLTNKGKDVAPARTIAGRAKDPKAYQTPAPGTYQVEDDYKFVAEAAPRYSFGTKSDLATPNNVPAPNSYDPRLGEAGPKYTMPGRPRDAKKFQTPAPGTYEVDDDYDFTMEAAPRYSFGQKPDLTVPNIVPAPNTYDPKAGEAGPKYTIPGRGKDPLDERTKFPAPGTYDPSKADAALNKSPAYTMRQKTALPQDRTKKPAPNAYNPDDKVTKPRDAQHSFGMKHSPYMGSLKSPGTPERPPTMQTSAIKPTDKVLRGGEVVRVTSDGLTCRWVDRGLAAPPSPPPPPPPRTNTSTQRTVETRTNVDGSHTTRHTTRLHHTVQMTVQ